MPAGQRVAATDAWRACPIPDPMVPIDLTIGTPVSVARDDGLLWACRVVSVGGGGHSAFRLWSVGPASGESRGDVLVFAGRNGDPAQITGQAAPDYPDRPIALRLAQARYRAHLIDYLPPEWDGHADRAAGLARARADLQARGKLLGDEIIALATALLRSPDSPLVATTAICGQSVGAFLAAHAIVASGFRGDAILSSGVVSTKALFGAQGLACDLHRVTRPFTGFGDLLAQARLRRLQIQIGLHDGVFAPTDLMTAAEAVQRVATFPVTIEPIEMGHAFHAATALRFLGEEVRDAD